MEVHIDVVDVLVKRVVRGSFFVWRLAREQWALLEREEQVRKVEHLPAAEVEIQALQQALEERARGGFRRAAIGIHQEIRHQHKPTNGDPYP